MGGHLYLQNSQKPNRSNICISGYTSGLDNYSLSNFAENVDTFGGRLKYKFNDPDMGNVEFKTAEVYLHFQKLSPEAKKGKYQKWKEASAGEILGGIRNKKSKYYISPGEYKFKTWNSKKNKYDFNSVAWDKHKILVQMQINAVKYNQNPEFKKCIDDAIAIGKIFNDGLGAATIIEDTSSASKVEVLWGTGPNGKGDNLLGITQMAFANMIDAGQKTDTIPITESYKENHLRYYNNAKDAYNKFKDTLIDIRKRSGYHGEKLNIAFNISDKNTYPNNNMLDTSQLSSKFVKKFKLAGNKIAPINHSNNQYQYQYQPSSGPNDNSYYAPGDSYQTKNIPSKVKCYQNHDSTKVILKLKGNENIYLYRSSMNSNNWVISENNPRYSNCNIPSESIDFIQSKGRNQVLMTEDNGHTFSGFYRDNTNSLWKIPNNLSKFRGLMDYYNNNNNNNNNNNYYYYYSDTSNRKYNPTTFLPQASNNAYEKTNEQLSLLKNNEQQEEPNKKCCTIL